MDDLQQDLTRVRELRADAPRPDRARLAAGRARLRDAAGGAAPVRRFRADWRLAAVGAAALTAAVVVAVDFLGASGGRVSDPAARPGYSAPALGTIKDAKGLGDAATVLRRAADTVEQTPVSAPRDGQWVYTRFVDAGRVEGGPRPRESESWEPYDDPSRAARKEYRLLRALSGGPERVKEKVRELEPDRPASESPAQYDFRLLGGLSQAFPADPEGRAEVFRAMAAVPGVTAAEVEDNLGRTAVAVGQGTLGKRGFSDFQLLYDPETFAPLGERSIAGREGAPDDDDRDGWKAGDVISTHALVERALVDGKGRRP